MFERYVNFEFYKTTKKDVKRFVVFERYVNFEFYKTQFNSTIGEVSLRDM